MRAVTATMLIVFVIAGAFVTVGVGLDWPFSLRDQFRLTNSSGRSITVTSHHTGQSSRIEEGKALAVSHSTGRITIKQDGREKWTYDDLRILDFQGTRHAAIRNYPFPFGATLTVNLVLFPDGRLHILPSDGNRNLEHIAQPTDFPLAPANAKED